MAPFVIALVLSAALDAPPLVTAPGLEGLSREQLRAAHVEAELQRPSLGPPIALVAAGGGAYVGAILFWVYGALFSLWGTAPALPGGPSPASVLDTGYTLLGIGAALTVAAAVLIPSGLVRLFGTLEARKPYSARMDEIDARLDALGP